MIVVRISGKAAGRFDARIGDRLVASGTQTPFLDAARLLASEGHDLKTVITLRHQGVDRNLLCCSIGSMVVA